MTVDLNGQTWELDTAEQASIEVFLTELRRAREHQPWCDRKQHRQVVADGLEDSGCVGRMIKATGGEVTGWWHQDEPGAEPRFYVDANGGGWDPSRKDLEVVDRLLSSGPKDDLWGLIGRALGELEHGISCGKQS
ncbi:hypothetical protein [Blastococcus sp. TBT05-19]|uniref:hypothetical protein n=1 Tax=Blastococcus sp. TBT05-19 TaxID=2250581 RepID=UPI0013141AD4|nr:hypothetical protein [Blastococcus sp. TBT05-19]